MTEIERITAGMSDSELRDFRGIGGRPTMAALDLRRRERDYEALRRQASRLAMSILRKKGGRINRRLVEMATALKD